MKKVHYQATVKDENGKVHTFSRESAHNYKFCWFVRYRNYGFNEYGEFDYSCWRMGFSTRYGIPAGKKVKEEHRSGKDWRGNDFENHFIPLCCGVVPVEIVK